MIGRILRYLFKPPRRQDQLPLLPRRYTSLIGPDIEPEIRRAVMLLVGQNAARTQLDARRLIKKYPDLSVQEIIDQEQRQRRHRGKWHLAKKRFKRMIER